MPFNVKDLIPSVKDDKGDYIVLTGNMTGALLTEYILSQTRVLVEYFVD